MEVGTEEYFRAKTEFAEWCRERLEAMKDADERFLLTPKIEDILWTDEEIKAQESFTRRLGMSLHNMGWEPGVNLVWLANFHRSQGVPIDIRKDSREGGWTVFGRNPYDIRNSKQFHNKPENYSLKLYNINRNKIMAMEVQAPCPYTSRKRTDNNPFTCYYDSPEEYTCPIGPLCRALEDVEDIG